MASISSFFSSTLIKPCPNFLEKNAEEARTILEEEFSSLDCSDENQKQVLEQIKSLNIEKVRKVFSLLSEIVRPTHESDTANVDKICNKINKRSNDKVECVVVIAAMFLKGYSTNFYRNAPSELGYWHFEAELIVKLKPMMLAKLKENQDCFSGKVNEYPNWIMNKINNRLEADRNKYKFSAQKLIGDSIVHIFYTKRTWRDKVLKDKVSKVYESIIFLVNPSQQGVDPTIVLSTKGAWEDVRPLCSERFSKHISTSFAPYNIQTEQVYTKQLIGPSSSSDIRQRAPVALDIDPTVSTCHAFTATFPPFEGIEGKNVRIKFFDEGIYIDKKLSLESYEKFSRFFIAHDKHIQLQKGPTYEWGMPQLPNNVKQVIDENIVKKLNDSMASYLTNGIAETLNFVDFEITDEIRLRADKFTVWVISHRYDDSFVELPFKKKPECSIQKIKEALLQYRNKSPFLHSSERWNAHLLKGNITLEYRIDGITSKKNLLECLEGRLEKSDGTVYFRSLGRWYQFDKTYYSELIELTSQLNSDFFRAGDEGYLGFQWDRKVIGEEDYSRLYIQYETNKTWFDANRKSISNVEICDIMLSTSNSTYLYHLKKIGPVTGDQNLGTSLRIIASQLMTSAEIIRGEINKGIKEGSELYMYCNKIKGSRPSPIAAFKKDITFVLAIPFPSGDPVTALLESRSTTVKREIIRMKKRIEELGFKFKIAPIPVIR